MAQARCSITALNQAAQGASAEIAAVCGEYVAAHQAMDAGNSNRATNAAGKTIRAAVLKLSGIKARSIADLRAKWEVFNIEADGLIEQDHSATDLFNSISADLEGFSAPAAGIDQIRDGLENLAAKLDSLRGAFSCLASMTSGQSEEPLFYMLMNHVEELRDAGNAIVDQVFTLKRGEG